MIPVQPSDTMDIGTRTKTSSSASIPKTVLSSIEEKYSPDDPDLSASEFGYIVFVSNSPETKKGMFPHIMTLIDYDIESVGELNMESYTTDRSATLLYRVLNSICMNMPIRSCRQGQSGLANTV